MEMRFVVLDRFGQWPSKVPNDYSGPTVTLRQNTWNDYGFVTSFDAHIIGSSSAKSVSLGQVKIIFADQDVEDRTVKTLDVTFSRLPESYCSLGQDILFYSNLLRLGREIADDYLSRMNDVAFDDRIKRNFENKKAFRVSLVRMSSALEALENAKVLYGENAAPVIDKFDVRIRLPNALGDHRLSFDFQPHNGLPHRTSVLVGLNGAGKTAILARLAFLITRFESSSKSKSRTAAGKSFEDLGTILPRPSLYSVIAVSFSAFDDFELPKIQETDDYRYVYCGLRTLSGGFRSEREISNRVLNIITKMSSEQLRFISSILPSIVNGTSNDDYAGDKIQSRSFYANLSAGQRIVLNIICELVISVRKRSLILLDEPETHLHPQLLTTLISIINDILDASDSYAIVATHSPIVVQQVPSRSVQVIRRRADGPSVTKPRIECFGESLTEIVRTVFEAVESDRDYEQVIDGLLAAHDGNIKAVEDLFENGIGLNARLYLQSRAI